MLRKFELHHFFAFLILILRVFEDFLLGLGELVTENTPQCDLLVGSMEKHYEWVCEKAERKVNLV